MRRGARSLKSESLGQRRSVRKPKTIHNFVFPASIGERPTRGPSYGCEPSIFLNGIPIGLLEKKLWLIMCCHFLGPDFCLEKSSFVQKKSSRDDFLKTVETRRKFTLKSLYFWNRVSTILKKSSERHTQGIVIGTCDDCVTTIRIVKKHGRNLARKMHLSLVPSTLDTPENGQKASLAFPAGRDRFQGH